MEALSAADHPSCMSALMCRGNQNFQCIIMSLAGWALPGLTHNDSRIHGLICVYLLQNPCSSEGPHVNSAVQLNHYKEALGGHSVSSQLHSPRAAQNSETTLISAQHFLPWTTHLWRIPWTTVILSPLPTFLLKRNVWTSNETSTLRPLSLK
jgi:hypothetical protein